MSTPQIFQANNIITLCNHHATWEVATWGHSIAFRMDEQQDDMHWVHSSNSFASCLIRADNDVGYIELLSTDITLSEPSSPPQPTNTLIITLTKNEHPGVQVRMEVRCEARPDYFLFELLHIGSANPESPVEVVAATVGMLNIKGEHYGGYLSAVHWKAFTIAPVALNMTTHTYSTQLGDPVGQYVIRGQSFSSVQLLGMQFAMLACTSSQWLDRLKDIVHAFSLPSPVLDGYVNKEHPDVNTSYLFVDITEVNDSDKIIQFAKRGRFEYILLYSGNWSETLGSYNINPDHFPGGIGALKTLVEKVHNHGLKFGLHCLSFFISRDGREPIVSPVPDPGLAKESPLTLSGPIDNGLIPVGSPDKLGQYKDYIEAGEKDILINEEIILISGVQDTEPYGLTVEQRGYLNTIEGNHEAGDTIYHLPQFFGSYLPAPDTSLPGCIARSVAHVFNATKADFLFLDGAEGLVRLLEQWPTMRRGVWYSAALTTRKYMPLLQNLKLLQTSSLQADMSYQWHLDSRGSAGDFAANGVEAHMDNIRIGYARDKLLAHSFLPQELGWIALLAKVDKRVDINNDDINDDFNFNASFASTTLDEMEYIMNRALGFNLPISLETYLDEIEANGMADNIFTMIGEYEKLRQNNYFPDSVLRKLQYPSRDFIREFGLSKVQYNLVKKTFPVIRYGFKKQAYLERVMKPGDQWDFNNPFGAQPLKVKITALPILAAFGDPDNIELLDRLEPADKGNYMESLMPDLSDNHIQATYSPPSNLDHPPEFGWCAFKQPLRENLINNKGLEVDITSDGKGEVLAIQLIDNIGNFRQFDLVVDFTGRQHIRIPLPSANNFYDYEPWFGDVMALRFFNWLQVVGLHVYVKHIPRSTEIDISLHSIKALHQRFETLSKPSLSLGSRTLTFLTTLSPKEQGGHAEPWHYLEYTGWLYRKYDGNHNPAGSGLPLFDGLPFPLFRPQVAAGENSLVFNHNGKNLALLRILLEEDAEYVV